MKAIKFAVHSIIDVITNSSTEIFISAKINGIDKIKELVNSLLEHSGSSDRFDDILTIKFICGEDERTPDMFEVSPKIKTGNIEAVAKILSSLEDLFEPEEFVC